MDRPEATSRKAVASRAAWTGGRRPGWARVWLCAAAIAAIVLAGCGSISASSTGAATAASPKASSSPSPSPSVSPSAAATQAALCQRTATVTGLVITRNHVMRVPQLQVGFPNQVIVATPARARAAARALCGLPSLPRGVFHCPNLTIGSTYLLRFTADGRQLPAVSIEATGCEVVTGVGPARWAAKSPGFWRALATAANVSPPGRTAFTGGGTSSCQPISSRPDQANDCPEQNAPVSGAVS
ncbi:MAG: hypothetical protein WA895_19290 [Streptosporangiaceae bacterium]